MAVKVVMVAKAAKTAARTAARTAAVVDWEVVPKYKLWLKIQILANNNHILLQAKGYCTKHIENMMENQEIVGNYYYKVFRY